MYSIFILTLKMHKKKVFPLKSYMWTLFIFSKAFSMSLPPM